MNTLIIFLLLLAPFIGLAMKEEDSTGSPSISDDDDSVDTQQVRDELESKDQYDASDKIQSAENSSPYDKTVGWMSIDSEDRPTDTEIKELAHNNLS